MRKRTKRGTRQKGGIMSSVERIFLKGQLKQERDRWGCDKSV